MGRGESSLYINNSYTDIEIISSGYGQPSIDKIGYHGYSPAIPIPRTFFVSAHAPSKLKVNFKNSGKYYINGMLNKTSGICNDSLTYKIYTTKNNKIILETKTSLIYHAVYFDSNIDYIFDISCNNNYGAHTIWNFYKAEEDLTNIELEALQIAQQKTVDVSSDYSLFIQTCNPRKKMAWRCIVSLLNNIDRMPKKIILCSLDNINDGALEFPSNVEFWNGPQLLNSVMLAAGLSNNAIDHIFNGFKNTGNPNMWLKYVIPRLCIDENYIIVSDDDVAFMGRCEKLLESRSYLTFMEDHDPFYGERTIDFYNKTYNTNIFQKIPPFVCAGIYKLNKSKYLYDSTFINDLILRSEHDTDEQSAVGMEIIKNRDFTKLIPPKYHHGGFINQNINMNELELMHMQGRAVGWRNNKDFIHKYIMPKNYD